MKFLCFYLLTCADNAAAGRVVGPDMGYDSSVIRIDQRTRHIMHVIGGSHGVKKICYGFFVSVAEFRHGGRIGIHDVFGIETVGPDPKHVTKFMDRCAFIGP